MNNLEKFKKGKIGKLVKMKDISRKGYYYFRREAMSCMYQYNLKEKFYVIERLRLEKTTGFITNKNNKIGQIEYRIGYYIVGKIGRAKGRWVWGQFCPMIPQEDFKKLLNLATKEKTI